MHKKESILKSRQQRKVADPQKQTMVKGMKISKMDIPVFLSSRASDTINDRLERMLCVNTQQRK